MLWDSLDAELDLYVSAKENKNWEKYYKVCGRLANYYRKEDEVDKWKEFLMEGVIFELQGGQNYGEMDEMDKDLFGEFDFNNDFGPLIENSLDSLVMAGYSIRDIKEVYDNVWTKVRLDKFPRSKENVWKDIRDEIGRLQSVSKSLLINSPDEYTYPHSIKYGYPTQHLLDKKDLEKRESWLNHIESFTKTKFGEWIDNTFGTSEMSNRLIEYDSEHGIFGQVYLTNNVWSKVKIESKKEELGLIKEIVSHSNLEYPIHTHKKEPPYKLILEYLYYMSFLKKRYEIEKICREWVESNREKKECKICGREFRVIDIPHFIYRGSDAFKRCCFSCPIVERPDREEMKDRIQEFVDVCGFIPNSSFGPSVYSFNSRLSDEDKIEVYEKYAKMGGLHVSDEFDSWFKALDESDALPDGFRYSGTGVWCSAKDGHKCHSLAEQRIDNWLTKHGIDHTREPEYPEHEDYNPSGRRKADWKTEDDVFIEYFGMVGNSSYDEKTEEKLALADEHGIDLLPIYPKDLEDLDNQLNRLID